MCPDGPESRFWFPSNCRLALTAPAPVRPAGDAIPLEHHRNINNSRVAVGDPIGGFADFRSLFYRSVGERRLIDGLGIALHLDAGDMPGDHRDFVGGAAGFGELTAGSLEQVVRSYSAIADQPRLYFHLSGGNDVLATPPHVGDVTRRAGKPFDLTWPLSSHSRDAPA